PLTFPKLAFAHHKAVAQQKGNTVDGLPFFVVLPVFDQDVLSVLRVTNHIHIGPIDRRSVNVSEPPKLIPYPPQKLLSAAVLLGRSRGDSSALSRHFWLAKTVY